MAVIKHKSVNQFSPGGRFALEAVSVNIQETPGIIDKTSLTFTDRVTKNYTKAHLKALFDIPKHPSCSDKQTIDSIFLFTKVMLRTGQYCPFFTLPLGAELLQTIVAANIIKNDIVCPIKSIEFLKKVVSSYTQGIQCETALSEARTYFNFSNCSRASFKQKLLDLSINQIRNVSVTRAV